MKKLTTIMICASLAVQLFWTRPLGAQEEPFKYSSVEDIVKDGDKAVGREAELKLKPVAVTMDTVTFTDGKGTFIKAYFKLEKRRLIRRLRRNEYYMITLEIKTIKLSGEIIYEFVSGVYIGSGDSVE